ncbi:hypothetical protein SISSUDRAFT_1037676 [Sistotremastrum suecicum HHB10207 ss-3]|uniref:Uncharacterized protein n=1 Tax=Sistotremastrum suecicum HHB10207 ss-3 TaxID=1314776 RepID=A0A165XTL3_9AGAM|nr:hypothetical protein SISSUDRAFT_1037676 [Sistotremastrum suecicum HHB10207 ss-3]
MSEVDIEKYPPGSGNSTTPAPINTTQADISVNSQSFEVDEPTVNLESSSFELGPSTRAHNDNQGLVKNAVEVAELVHSSMIQFCADHNVDDSQVANAFIELHRFKTKGRAEMQALFQKYSQGEFLSAFISSAPNIHQIETPHSTPSRSVIFKQNGTLNSPSRESVNLDSRSKISGTAQSEKASSPHSTAIDRTRSESPSNDSDDDSELVRDPPVLRGRVSSDDSHIKAKKLISIELDDLPTPLFGSWPRSLRVPPNRHHPKDSDHTLVSAKGSGVTRIEIRKALKEIFLPLAEPDDRDQFKWRQYPFRMVELGYVLINIPYGLPPMAQWDEFNPSLGEARPGALFFEAILAEDPSKRMCIVHRRHFAEDAQPALFSYVNTNGNDIVYEDTFELYGNASGRRKDLPTRLPEFDSFGACKCNLSGCIPPDLSPWIEHRPIWKPDLKMRKRQHCSPDPKSRKKTKNH